MRIFCNYCGAANPPDARFCLDCRTLIALPPASAELPADSRSPAPVELASQGYPAGNGAAPAQSSPVLGSYQGYYGPPPPQPPMPQLSYHQPSPAVPQGGYAQPPYPQQRGYGQTGPTVPGNHGQGLPQAGYGQPVYPIQTGYSQPPYPVQSGAGSPPDLSHLPPYGPPRAGALPGYGPLPAYGTQFPVQPAYGLPLVPAGAGGPAEFWPRLGALLVDYCILGSLWFCLMGLSVFMELPALGMLATFLGPALYFIGFWATSGRTPGYKAAGLQLVRTDYTKADLGNSIVRYIGTMISWSFFCLGYLWMLWDPERQTWHDKMASTRVIKT